MSYVAKTDPAKLELVQLCQKKIGVSNFGHSLRSAVQTAGACRLEPESIDSDVFLNIASHLGTIQSHKRIVGNGNTVDKSWIEHKKEYIGTNNSFMAPHTDGSFLCGAIVEKDKLRAINPPALLLLQCIVPAENGGDHLITDCKPIIEYLIDSEPEVLRILSTSGNVAVCRDDQLSIDIGRASNIP